MRRFKARIPRRVEVLAREPSVLHSVLVVLWRARSFGAAMYATALLAVDGG
jgi:hypothetical protein